MFFWLHRTYILHSDLSSLLNRYRSLRHTCASVTTNMRVNLFWRCASAVFPPSETIRRTRDIFATITVVTHRMEVGSANHAGFWTSKLVAPANQRAASFSAQLPGNAEIFRTGPEGLERVVAWTQRLGYCTRNNQHSLYFGVFLTYNFNYMGHADLGIHMWVFHCH